MKKSEGGIGEIYKGEVVWLKLSIVYEYKILWIVCGLVVESTKELCEECSAALEKFLDNK